MAMKPVGILICKRLYDSVMPALTGKEFSGYPVVIYPHHCSGSGDWKKDFNRSVSEISSRCRKFCILTCACPNYVFSPDDFDDKLIKTRQGAELLIPEEKIGEMIKEGDYFLFPARGCEKESYSCYLPVFEIIKMNGNTEIRRIVIADTGASAICSDFVREIGKISKVPLKVEKTGLDFFSNYLGRILNSAEKQILIDDSVRIKKDLADSMMALDMLGMLVGIKSEAEIIEKMIELNSILFSPAQIVYVGIKDEKIVSVSELNPDIISCPGIDIVPGLDIPDFGKNTPGDGFRFPVTVGNEIVGIICIEKVEFPGYIEKYKNTASQILPLCGLAIANARNYSDLNSTIRERDEEIELKERAEEALSKAIKKLGLLSSITRHDILNQIMVVNYHLEVAVGDSPRLAEELSPVIKAVSQIQRQIEFTRDYQEMGVSPPSWQSLPPLIRECFSERDYPPEVKVTIDLQEIEIFGDPMLGKAFCNVISNAYNHAEGMTGLKISGESSGENFIIRIADNGQGVAADRKEQIFKPGFGRIHGYGLFLVTEVLGITDIRIKECGTEGEGAVFEIAIPPGSWRKKGE